MVNRNVLMARSSDGWVQLPWFNLKSIVQEGELVASNQVVKAGRRQYHIEQEPQWDRGGRSRRVFR